MKCTSFMELTREVHRLRERGDYTGALELVAEHLNSFPPHKAFLYLTQAELLAELGRARDALQVLDQAVSAGCRYTRQWLETNPRLASVIPLADFPGVAQRSQQQWDEAADATKPAMSLLTPHRVVPSSGLPLLVVLHGNNSNTGETLPHWQSAVDEGWATAVLQSGEAGATPGAFTWNDRARTGQELEMHLEAIKREIHVNEDSIVLAGFSMGALQAIALVITQRIRVRGVVPIAAWLPHIREFSALAAAGAAAIKPTYAVVGSNDPSYEGAKQLVSLISAHGGKSHLDERQGLGHEYPGDMAPTLARALAFVGE